MLAVEGHWTAAFTVEVDEPVATEIQLNLDAIGVEPAPPHFGADMREIFTDFQSAHASLGPIGNRLFERRTAEEGIDLLLLQYIGEREIHIHDGEDLLHQKPIAASDMLTQVARPRKDPGQECQTARNA